MKIQVNTVVTLENNEQYVVLSETLYQGSKYFLMMGINGKEVISSKVAIFKEEIQGLDIYVNKVLDPILKSTLTDLLKEE